MRKNIFLLLISSIYILNVAAQDTAFVNSIGIQFVLIKPGTMTVGKFQPTVGSKDFDGTKLSQQMVEKSEQMAKADFMPGFEVKINKAFYMGKYEITQSQWLKIMGKNPSAFQHDSSSNQPVENITWKDAQAFVKKLNALDKEHVYRLPTEFEWEYAARAGAQDDISWKDIQATAVLGGLSPRVGGTKKSNPWGIYDMLGNVWEWVQDVYNEKIFADPIPPRKGKEHVLKGSSFTGDVKNATYMTHAAGPGNGFDIGLRIVMETK